jgi:hypothetical protein
LFDAGVDIPMPTPQAPVTMASHAYADSPCGGFGVVAASPPAASVKPMMIGHR